MHGYLGVECCGHVSLRRSNPVRAIPDRIARRCLVSSRQPSSDEKGTEMYGGNPCDGRCICKDLDWI